MIKIIPYNDTYETEVISLLFKNNEILSDDYYPLDTIRNCFNALQFFKDRCFIGLDDDKLINIFYIYDIYATHSCKIMGVSKRKVNPQKNRAAFNIFLNILYEQFNFIKISATTNKNNIPAQRILKDLRFKKEGFLKGMTLKNNKLDDYLLFSKINSKYLTNTRKGI